VEGPEWVRKGCGLLSDYGHDCRNLFLIGHLRQINLEGADDPQLNFEGIPHLLLLIGLLDHQPVHGDL